MKEKFIYLVWVVLVCAACVDDDYQLYDTSQINRIYFARDSAAFIYGPREDRECDLEIPVKLIGMANLDEDMEFRVVADEKRSTAKAGIHYRLDGKQFFRKDSVMATVRLDFIKPALIRDMEYTLYLYLQANENFRPTNKVCCVLRFGDITLPQPAWWMPDRLGTYNQDKLVLFMKYFWATESITPVLYEQIVTLWGKYLDNEEHWRFPWLLTTYTYVGYFRQYVYTPMYAYYLETGDEHYRIPNPLD